MQLLPGFTEHEEIYPLIYFTNQEQQKEKLRRVQLDPDAARANAGAVQSHLPPQDVGGDYITVQ